MKDKVYSMFGLAQKAGKLVSGDYTCEMTIKTKKCFLVVIAKDASDRTKKKFKNMCKFRNVKVLEFGNKNDIGNCIGKGVRTIIGIKDNNFANKIESLILEIINGGEPIA